MEGDNFPFSDPFMLSRFERTVLLCTYEWKVVRERSFENEITPPTAFVWGF